MPQGVNSFMAQTLLPALSGEGAVHPIVASRALNRGEEGTVGVDEGVGHTWRVEGRTGIAVFVEEDEAAGAFAAFGEELHSSLASAGGRGRSRPKEIARGLGEDDAHDGFTIAGRRDRASFGVGVAAAADQRRIANAAGEFAAGAAGRRGGEKSTLVIESDGADGALFVPAVMLGGVRVDAATLPGLVFSGRDEFRGITKGKSLIKSEFLRAFADEHHVRGFLKNGTCGLNR